MVALLASGCFNPKYNNPACGPMGECPSGLVCMEGTCRPDHDGGADASVVDDAGREIVTWTLDAAADFTRPGAFLGDTGVEPWGSLTSGAYLPGGVVVRGVASALWDLGQTDAQLTWTPVATATIAGTGVARAADIDGFFGFTQYGVSGAGAFSLIIEGEIFLDQIGQHGFAVSADDIAFLEIAPPGTGSFEQVAVGRVGVSTPRAYDAPVVGWYPFRIGFSQTINLVQLRLRHSAVGSATLAPIDRAHLRGRGDPHRGLHRSVYNKEIMATDREVVGMDQRAFLAMTDFNAERMPGMPAGTDNWSARWSGQFYTAVAGDYHLNVISDDGNQILFADQRDADHWSLGSTAALASTNVTATLAVGWHPIIVDYNEVIGANTMKVLVKTSPDATLVNDQPIPLERLRPVETGERAIAGTDGNDDTILSGSAIPASESMVFAGFAGETVAAVEVSVSLSGPHFEDFVYELLRPDGTALVLLDPGLSGSRDQTVQFRVTDPTFLATATVAGTWAVHVRDPDNTTGHTGNGQLKASYVTLHTTAGHPTVATDAFWTSQVIDLEARPLLDVTKVTWQGRTPRDPSDIEIQMRACATADCAAGEAWSAAIPNGMAPVLTSGSRYLQARVRLRSDGTRESELEQLQIVYRRPAK